MGLNGFFSGIQPAFDGDIFVGNTVEISSADVGNLVGIRLATHFIFFRLGRLPKYGQNDIPVIYPSQKVPGMYPLVN